MKLQRLRAYYWIGIHVEIGDLALLIKFTETNVSDLVWTQVMLHGEMLLSKEHLFVEYFMFLLKVSLRGVVQHFFILFLL